MHKPLFQLDDVSHTYGEVFALRDVSLDVERGAIGLIGPNGAGKSTLIRLLMGFRTPTEGTVRTLCVDPVAKGFSLRGRLGYLPESGGTISLMTGLEYVALAGELCGMSRRQALRRGHELLSDFGMEDARYRRLDGYSFGMRQRIRLAATLVHDPELLLLDEPTSGLDPDGRADMLELIKRLCLRDNRSLLLTSHRLADVERVCDRVIVLSEGQLIAHRRKESEQAVLDAASAADTPYAVDWDGDESAYLETLRAAGCVVDQNKERNVVRLPESQTTQLFFAAAQQCGVVITGLSAVEESLADAYRRLTANWNVVTPTSSQQTDE